MLRRNLKKTAHLMEVLNMSSFFLLLLLLYSFISVFSQVIVSLLKLYGNKHVLKQYLVISELCCV